MKTYLVGGAVRDQLLGLEPRDFDYLVIDSSPEEMKKLGFIQVGLSYDVFLHPKTKNEYVLAESLEKDLARRDLTINSMARDENGNLIDLFNGQQDLALKILRHTSVHFSDDPLRVYRLARFKAQYADFQVAPETMLLGKSLAQTEDFMKLNGERILGELKEVLSSGNPEEFFVTLKELNALAVHFDIIRDWSGLNFAAGNFPKPMMLFAFMMRKNTRKEIELLAARIMIQNDWLEAALVASKIFSLLPQLEKMNATELVNLFYELDAFRKPDHIHLIEKLFPEAGKKLAEAFYQVSKVSIKDVAQGLSGKEIGEAIKNERIRSLKL